MKKNINILILLFLSIFIKLYSMQNNVNNSFAIKKDYHYSQNQKKNFNKNEFIGLLDLPVELIINILIQGIKDIVKNNNIQNPFFNVKDYLIQFYQVNKLSKSIILNHQNYITNLVKIIVKEQFAFEYLSFSKEQLNNKLRNIILDPSICNDLQKTVAKLIISGVDPDLLVIISAKNFINIQIYPLIVYMCKFSFCLNILDLFKHYKVDVNARSYNGLTALIAAINSHLSIEIINKLVDLNPDFNIKDNWQWSALIHAINQNRDDVVEVILNKGGASIKDDTYFHYLYNYHNKKTKKILNLLIKFGMNLDLRDSDGNTALMSAINYSKCYNKIIKKLIKAGADVNIKNNYGQTALNIEVTKSLFRINIKTIEALLEAGADVNSTDNTGTTILDYLLLKPKNFKNEKEKFEIIKLLKKFKAI